MEIKLTKDHQEFVDQLLKNGTYEHLDFIIDDALWLLRDHLALRRVKEQELRELLQVGIDQAERGETVSGDDVFRRLEEKIQARQGTPTP
jgi:Arc/MetJ-type ribon-helix-helix transcriptional regulator